MIVFIPANDEPTRENYLVAQHIAHAAPFGLVEADAVRANIVDALLGAPFMPLLVFSHGSREAIWGHDGSIALDPADVAMLVARVSYAHACRTAEQLGKAVRDAGGVWFGFVGTVNALPADAAIAHHFVSLADFIAANFPGCTTEADVLRFIAELDALALGIIQELSAAGEASLERIACLREVTRRLRVYLPGRDEPIKHVEAFGDPLF